MKSKTDSLTMAACTGALVALGLWLAFTWGGLTARQDLMTSESVHTRAAIDAIRAENAAAMDVVARSLETTQRMQRLMDEMQVSKNPPPVKVSKK